MPDTGFPCSADADARLLILGSMPGQKSLAEQQYYAHPRNAFWPIIGALLDIDPALPYRQRLELLRSRRVALWDVAHQCVRPGSMDHAIEPDSVVANDFAAFFAAHPAIRAICFNGRKAQELYRRLVQPHLPEPYNAIAQHLLPSTSPANAGMTQARKLAAWQIILAPLESG
jgi:hypoxanthine-DNA glycosylase